jgi:hypothetical protein
VRLPSFPRARVGGCRGITQYKTHSDARRGIDTGNVLRSGLDPGRISNPVRVNQNQNSDEYQGAYYRTFLTHT